MVTGSVAGSGKAARLKNSAFASAGNWKNGAKLSHAAFQGKFANQKFANQNWNHNWHGWKGWNNWHGGWWWWNRPIIVIGWFGGLFWPFAYWDFVDYTFWPYAYDAFWPYAYDDLYVGCSGHTPTKGRSTQIEYEAADTRGETDTSLRLSRLFAAQRHRR
jgi:hypothetical protein